MLLSSVSFAVVNFSVKLLANKNDILPDVQEYPIQELVFFRSVISLSICIAIIRARKIPFFGNNVKWLVLRGIFGVTALTMFFATIDHLPIAIATVVQYMSPIFTVIFAIFLLKERVERIQWIFFLVSMSGIWLIGYARDSNVDFNIGWLFVGLGSAVISGLAYNSIMKCRHTDKPITIVMYFPLIATPVMAAGCLIFGYVVPVGIEWFLLLLIGVMTQIAQVTMTRAFHSDAAARVTPVKYIGAIYAILIGFFLFDETLGFYSSIGIALILLGVLFNTFYKKMFNYIHDRRLRH